MAKRAKSLEEIARRYEAMIDDESQDAQFVPVTAHVEAKGSVISTHFSSEEIDIIFEAAKQR